jgi:flagellar biosynthesis/type III secretory pathway protein FliH
MNDINDLNIVNIEDTKSYLKGMFVEFFETLKKIDTKINIPDVEDIIFHNSGNVAISNIIVECEEGKVINYLTDSKLELDEERDEINMCKGLDEFAAKAKSEGKAEGKAEGRAEGEINKLNENIKTMHSNGFDAETIARALSLDINYVKEVLSK